LILIGGGLDDGSENEPLAAELAREFTTFNYARRGRGRSGDTAPYSVVRELEDLAALIEIAGGHAHVSGTSSGGMYALEASGAGLSVDRVAVYEVPYDVDPDVGERYVEYRREIDAALSSGDRGGAAERTQLTGQGHVVEPAVFAPILERFLGGETVQS
jgi:hypothetical protein